MVRQDIDFIDNEYFRIPLVRPSRKIKFKNISFTNIYSLWNKFRIKRLKEKLSAKKEKLIEMEFSGEQLVPGKKREKVENKILKKTQAIARLESKIKFLETGEYANEDFINSRAIKLKSIMMQNLQYNRNSLYSINSDGIQQMENEDSKVDEIINEESVKVEEKLRQILGEDHIAKAKQEISPNTQKEQPVPRQVSHEEIISETSSTLNKNKTDDTEIPPMISDTIVAEAIAREMDRNDIHENQKSYENVNNFINEDGTYRLKREDIDEDFRITRFDRSKLPSEENEYIDENEPNLPPFSTNERIFPDIELPRKAITAMPEIRKYEFPELVMPSIRIADENESTTVNSRVVPIVVEDRNTQDNQSSEPLVGGNSVSEEEYVDGDIYALMERVKVLKAQKDTITTSAEEAAKRAESIDAVYTETRSKLAAYADSLEDDCNITYKEMQAMESNTDVKEEQINAMLLMMGLGTLDVSEKKTRVK